MSQYAKLQEENDLPTEDSLQIWGKQPGEYKEVVIRAIEKCREEQSKQMVHGGIYYERDEQTGQMQPVQMFSQKEIFKQTIDALYDLLIWFFDDKAERVMKNINVKLKEIPTKAYREYLNLCQSPESKQFSEKSKSIQSFGPQDISLSKSLIKKYESYKYSLYREMYQELLQLFKRKRDLSGRRTAAL